MCGTGCVPLPFAAICKEGPPHLITLSLSLEPKWLRLFIACPVHYHKLLCKTFGDPAVFQPCKSGTARIIQHLRQDFENQHPDLQVYGWAFQGNKGLPSARILPKGSKQFAKARLIIAYTKCWHTKASSFLATALYSIMQTLFPKGSTFNVNSVTSALQQAWKYLQHMDPKNR